MRRTPPPTVFHKIFAYVASPDAQLLLPCLRVNKLFFECAVPIIYNSITFKNSSGKRLQKLIDTLAFSQYPYAKNIKSIIITQISLSDAESTDSQSWELVKELLCRVAITLERLHIGTGDDGFLECEDCLLPQRTNFPAILEFSVQERCVKFSQRFLVDLLRRCCPATNTLRVLRFPQCLGGLDGTGWWLIAERGSASTTDESKSKDKSSGLEELELTAPLIKTDDPNNGWSPDLVNQGLIALQSLKHLRKLNLSGIQSISAESLESLLFSVGKNLKELQLMDCLISDLHLSVITNCIMAGNLPNLKRLNVGCSSCTLFDSPFAVESSRSSTVLTPRSARKRNDENGNLQCTYGNCGKISDSVLVLLLEKLTGRSRPDAVDVYLKSKRFPVGAEIVLPRWICEVKSGRKVPTITWAERLPSAKVEMFDTERVVYLDVAIEIPNGRMVA